MKHVLVNPPTLYWVKLINSHGQMSYLDLVLKHLGGIENAGHFPIEHIGLLSIKAYCASQGVKVGYVNGITEFHKTERETFDAIVRKFGDETPLLVGFSGPNLVFEENLFIIRKLKEKFPRIRCALGHDFASLNAKKIILQYPEIDYVICGDGEIAFCRLSQGLENQNLNESEIDGLVYRNKEGHVVANPAKVVDVNTLPFADRDDVLRTITHGFGVSVSSSRGCPYRCTFCTTGQTAAMIDPKNSHRIRDVMSVADEFEYLYKKFGARRFVVTDDLFLTKSPDSQARAKSLAEEIIRRELKISWMIDCRVDSIDIDLFRVLARSGLRQIFVGVETGSDKQRAQYDKKFAAKIDSAAVLSAVEALGIKVIPGILTFHPESDWQEMEQTLDLIEKLGTQNAYHFINRVKPYPGTKLYEEYRLKNWLTQEWPIADFKFKDSRLEECYQDLLRFCSNPTNSYEDSKNHFRSWVNRLASSN